jgi:hypothetical protein
MNRICYYIAGTVFLLLFFFHTNAQDTTVFDEAPTVDMADTTVYETSVSHYQFNEVNGANKVDIRNIPGQDVQKVKSDEDYWYANLTPPRKKKEPEPPKNNGSISNKTWFNTLFWIILIGGFLALLIWFLATSNISLFRRRVNSVEEGIMEETETENIFEIKFEKEIQKAIDAANFRLAVRLMYLRTLRDLSQRNLINYTHEKTNTDYLFQLAGSSFYKNFFRLTRNFDYTWYGQFPLSQESFSVIQNDFNSFKQQLS